MDTSENPKYEENSEQNRNWITLYNIPNMDTDTELCNFLQFLNSIKYVPYSIYETYLQFNRVKIQN